MSLYVSRPSMAGINVWLIAVSSGLQLADITDGPLDISPFVAQTFGIS